MTIIVVINKSKNGILKFGKVCGAFIVSWSVGAAKVRGN